MDYDFTHVPHSERIDIELLALRVVKKEAPPHLIEELDVSRIDEGQAVMVPFDPLEFAF